MKRVCLLILLLLCSAVLWGITPNDVAGSSDSERIENAIAAALADGSNKVVIPRYNERSGQNIWLIERAILLPSNLHLTLDNSLVRLAPGTQDNIMRSFGTTQTPMTGSTNVTVVGLGSATLSGGLGAHFNPPGDLSGWRTIGVLLYNVQDFMLADFAMHETQAWGISMENGCATGIVRNITFNNSNAYPNQDGVNVRKGCHNILIENIFGTTGDDSVALTGLRGSLDGSVTGRMHVGDAYPAASDDIYDITVRNIQTMVAGGHHTIRLLNHDGIKLYNIAISDVFDTSMSGQTRARAGIKIGDTGYWRLSQNQLGETYNIFVTNLHSRATSSVLIQGTLKDAVLCDLRPFDGSVPVSTGSMPTQGVVICTSPELPPAGDDANVVIAGAILEVDIAPEGCDLVEINGDVSISGGSCVEILSDSLANLRACQGRSFRVLCWSGIKEGSFVRKTNVAGWHVVEDVADKSIYLAYSPAATILMLR